MRNMGCFGQSKNRTFLVTASYYALELESSVCRCLSKWGGGFLFGRPHGERS